MRGNNEKYTVDTAIQFPTKANFTGYGLQKDPPPVWVLSSRIFHWWIICGFLSKADL